MVKSIEGKTHKGEVVGDKLLLNLLMIDVTENLKERSGQEEDGQA